MGNIYFDGLRLLLREALGAAGACRPLAARRPQSDTDFVVVLAGAPDRTVGLHWQESIRLVAPCQMASGCVWGEVPVARLHCKRMAAMSATRVSLHYHRAHFSAAQQLLHSAKRQVMLVKQLEDHQAIGQANMVAGSIAGRQHA